MKAVVSVLGKDMVGILSDVSNECAKANANVLEVTQTIIQDMFAMFMMIDITKLNLPLSEFSVHMEETGKKKSCPRAAFFCFLQKPVDFCNPD